MSEEKTKAADEYPTVMTVNQVAEYLQVSRRTVYSMAAAGSLPGKKVGEQWRFFKPELDKWLAQESAVDQEGQP